MLSYFFKNPMSTTQNECQDGSIQRDSSSENNKQFKKLKERNGDNDKNCKYYKY